MSRFSHAASLSLLAMATVIAVSTAASAQTCTLGTSSSGPLNTLTCIGAASLASNTTGQASTAIGVGALNKNTTGKLNTASGYTALLYNESGETNSGHGYATLFFNVSGSNNTASGAMAGAKQTGSNNTSLGAEAAYRGNLGDEIRLSGSNNIAVGYQAGSQWTTGSNNIVIGHVGGSNDANIIRIGTAGSLQADIPVDAFVASTHAIGIDNLLLYYQRETNAADEEILNAFIHHTHINSIGIQPYIAPASISLLKHFVTDFHQGITITTPGFYGPQGRVLRLKTAHPTLIDTLTHFHYGNHRVANFEMETSAIYGLGKLLGHACLSLSAIVANRVVQQFSTQANATIDRLIQKTLQNLSERNV